MGSSDLVVPFRGERYRAGDRLGRLIAPPYDVIAPAERARLAASDEHNIVHVMLPEAPPGWSGGDRYEWAASQLAAWRRAGVLVREAEPALYVMAQGARLGVFAALRAEGYEPRRVRPHEHTHAGPKADRLSLLRATATNVESIFVLAPDADGALMGALTAVSQTPPDATAELGGVGIRLWVVGGGAALSRFPLPPSPLYIADGHHRYETASTYAAETPEADRLLAFIASARDPGLVVLPTHRVIFGAERASGDLLAAWAHHFQVERLRPGIGPVEHLAALRAAQAGGRPACVVALPDGGDVVLVLKPDAPLDEVPGLPKSPAVRALDVAVIEELVVKPLLRLGAATPTLNYTADPRSALDAVHRGAAASAVLLNPTRVEQVFAVADAGEFMPPKSTYFVPKVPSGVVLRPLG
jgi:uncharacterized protein (DUF1015 family)